MTEHGYSRRMLLAGALVASASASVSTRATPRSARGGFFTKHNLPVGVQAYTVGEAVARDPAGAFARLAEIGFRTVELPGLLGRAPAALRDAATAAGLRITGLHMGAGPGQGNGKLSFAGDPAAIADAAAGLGVDSVILPAAPVPPHFRPRAGERFEASFARALAEAGSDHWLRTAELLNRVGGALRPQGIAVGYHNHSFELAPIGDTTGFDILARETEPALVSFEVDAGWVAASGLDPVRFIERHRGRVRWLHVKDVMPGAPGQAMQSTEVGAGSIRWSRVLPVAWRAGVRAFYVEQEPPFTVDRFAALAKSYAYLSTIA